MPEIVIGQDAALLPGKHGHLPVDPRWFGAGSQTVRVIGILPFPAVRQGLFQQAFLNVAAMIANHPCCGHSHPIDVLRPPLGQLGKTVHPSRAVFRRARETVGFEGAPDGADRILIRQGFQVHHPFVRES